MSVAPADVFTGRLERSPFPGRPVRAIAAPRPLRLPHDFAVVARFGRSRGTPVLLSYAEHFELLATVVARALACLPDLDVVLIRMRMPGTGRLPPDLLREEVLLVEEVDAELERLGGAGRSVLVIADRFLRNPQEQGDNGLTVGLHPGTAGDGFRDLVHLLISLGIRRVEEG